MANLDKSVNKITFILGGARSGKSATAVNLAKKYREVAFVATCLPTDNEMKKRVKLHKENRPTRWQTFEESRDLVPLLKSISPKFDIVIIDCLTILTSNLLLDGFKDSVIEEKIRKMLDTLKTVKFKSIIVSNEVGLGVHPNTKLGRRFRDLAGRINQLTAQKADEVFFMISGLPMKIKSS